VIRVGVLDSGIAADVGAPVLARARFDTAGGAQASAEASLDRPGHGTQVATIIARAAPACGLLDARVFGARLRCSAEQVAAGIDWLCEAGARLVNMSFGLAEDRAVLGDACRRAAARGVVLVASAPARGAAVFPASYPGVIRATGDARCAPGQISFLDTGQADFGAHVRAPDALTAGASIGCAHVSAALAAMLCAHPGWDAEQLRAELIRIASHRGPERRV